MKERFEGLVEHLLAGNIFLQQAVEVLERGMLQGALAQNGGNQSEAAKQLGIHRNTLQRKIVQYGLSDGRSRARRKPAGRQTRSRKAKSGAA